MFESKVRPVATHPSSPVIAIAETVVVLMGAGAETVQEMARAFRETDGILGERLMRALEGQFAARAEGLDAEEIYIQRLVSDALCRRPGHHPVGMPGLDLAQAGQRHGAVVPREGRLLHPDTDLAAVAAQQGRPAVPAHQQSRIAGVVQE